MPFMYLLSLFNRIKFVSFAMIYPLYLYSGLHTQNYSSFSNCHYINNNAYDISQVCHCILAGAQAYGTSVRVFAAVVCLARMRHATIECVYRKFFRGCWL
ncbi:unnamed protein product [Ceratitis capitata]|uniref:(Mediterranean fruit fly) hypothetical protein n=1 Tax=Ceratitis capitata TaxID=7213 RepID=A0A811U5V7_CERCA|nr:unnamed protein product [Ceratitis capitata]